VRYSNTFTYSRYKRTLQLSNGPRLKDSMRQFMASLSVEAYDLKVIKPQADEPLSSMLASSQWGTGPVCSSPGPWGAEQQQGGGGSAAGMSGQQASTSFRRAGVAQVSAAHVDVRGQWGSNVDKLSVSAGHSEIVWPVAL
jgi:hypothetical protein